MGHAHDFLILPSIDDNEEIPSEEILGDQLVIERAGRLILLSPDDRRSL